MRLPVLERNLQQAALASRIRRPCARLQIVFVYDPGSACWVKPHHPWANNASSNNRVLDNSPMYCSRSIRVTVKLWPVKACPQLTL